MGFPPWPDLWYLCYGMAGGWSPHLTPQTHLPSFSSLASSPVPFGFWLDSANGWHQTEVWGAREAWGRHIYSPPPGVPAGTFQVNCVPLRKDTACARQPFFPLQSEQEQLPTVAKSLCSTHLVVFPTPAHTFQRAPLLNPLQDSVYTCHLFLGRPWMTQS